MRLHFIYKKYIFKFNLLTYVTQRYALPALRANGQVSAFEAIRKPRFAAI